ncbi:putative mn2+ homeostasis protein per1 protein [Rosellinia necatrix]|uniref:Post-GPI attachment to proteins factor 3 n=1 Tax=Rosellinia necatrix TaxID=77044 RepID=A0A1W2TDN8_ROSNE|nr:putative mn2+ homeostasis protein per1 protein [Rosellinia necatrix]
MPVRWKTATRRPSLFLLLIGLVVCLFLRPVEASFGDKLPEFRECVKVCKRENCDPNNDPTPIPLHHRLLQWSCAQECDYTCQQIVTARRAAAGRPVAQFHGKWPFVRVLGVQEPFSVLFSLGNLAAHQNGLARLRERVPPGYPLRPYYELFGYFGTVAWVFSTIFHTRDFHATEQLDYFGAGASVLYGMYYALVRVARLDLPTPRRRSFLRLWTALCCALYLAHICYLKFWDWNYTYNMTANVVVGMVHNTLWSFFSWQRWRQTRQNWAIWPSMLVGWVMLAMGLELLDFPPLWGALDAHSLWHLGTIAPTIFWYSFMIKDCHDMARIAKLKESKA